MNKLLPVAWRTPRTWKVYGCTQESTPLTLTHLVTLREHPDHHLEVVNGLVTDVPFVVTEAVRLSLVYTRNQPSNFKKIRKTVISLDHTTIRTHRLTGELQSMEFLMQRDADEKEVSNVLRLRIRMTVIFQNSHNMVPPSIHADLFLRMGEDDWKWSPHPDRISVLPVNMELLARLGRCRDAVIEKNRSGIERECAPFISDADVVLRDTWIGLVFENRDAMSVPVCAVTGQRDRPDVEVVAYRVGSVLADWLGRAVLFIKNFTETAPISIGEDGKKIETKLNVKAYARMVWMKVELIERTAIGNTFKIAITRPLEGDTEVELQYFVSFADDESTLWSRWNQTVHDKSTLQTNQYTKLWDWLKTYHVFEYNATQPKGEEREIPLELVCTMDSKWDCIHNCQKEVINICEALGYFLKLSILNLNRYRKENPSSKAWATTLYRNRYWDVEVEYVEMSNKIEWNVLVDPTTQREEWYLLHVKSKGVDLHYSITTMPDLRIIQPPKKQGNSAFQHRHATLRTTDNMLNFMYNEMNPVFTVPLVLLLKGILAPILVIPYATYFALDSVYRRLRIYQPNNQEARDTLIREFGNPHANNKYRLF